MSVDVGGEDVPNARIMVLASPTPPAPLAIPSAIPLRPFPPSCLYFASFNKRAITTGEEYWASIRAPSNPVRVEVTALKRARIRLRLGDDMLPSWLVLVDILMLDYGSDGVKDKSRDG